MIQLSILIPTIPDRVEMFTKLYNEVQRQIEYCHTTHPSLGTVQVVVDGSKKFLDGGLSIGKKREELVKRAVGKYLCFLDDDEWIAPNYIEKLLRLANDDIDPDVITFSSMASLENYWCLVRMSVVEQVNQECKPGIVQRRPWHVCPVRSIYAKVHPFPDESYGEDWSWMEKVLKSCITEMHTEEILHNYRHGSHSEADKITKHVQSEQ